MGRRVLFATWCWPPLAAPEAILGVKAVRGLAGHEVDVLTLEPAWWQRRDESLVHYGDDVVRRVLRVDAPWWTPAIQPVRRVRRYPDAYRLALPRARRAARQLDLDDYDVLLTWSQYHSIHLLGLALRELRPTLPWMVHLSDPWVDNPLIPTRGVARRLAEGWERAVLGAADVVTFTAEETRRRTMARYPEDWAARAHVVPHPFDPTLYPPVPAPARRIVRHVGNFYAFRTPAPLLDALERIHAADPAWCADTTIELVGAMSGSMRRTVTQWSARTGVPIDLREPVSYVESLRLMREASTLLVIDGPATKSLFLASKTIDYVGAGRPIVAFVPEGASADLVRSLGGWVADPLDGEGCAAALRAGTEADPEGWGDDRLRTAYDVAHIGSRRAALLDDAVRRRSGSAPG